MMYELFSEFENFTSMSHYMSQPGEMTHIHVTVLHRMYQKTFKGVVWEITELSEEYRRM